MGIATRELNCLTVTMTKYFGIKITMTDYSDGALWCKTSDLGKENKPYFVHSGLHVHASSFCVQY